MLKSLRRGLLALAILVTSFHAVRAEQVQATVTKLADLPNVGVDGESPQNPRGGTLQIGDDLWFTTYVGGENLIGAIVSYNLVSGQFTTQHSFGLPDPSQPTQARYDGFFPWKTTMTMGTDGRVYYATQYGGASWQPGVDEGKNGGAIGSFDPATVRTTGVTTVWSGSVASNQPRNLGYTSPIYVSNSNGGASLYFTTYAGGSSDWGTIQKVNLDASGNSTGSTQITQFVGSNSTPASGRQPMGGMLLVNGKIYYSTGSGTASATSTLQVLDTATDQVTVLSNTWNIGNNIGGYSTPLYDEERNSIYTVTLSGGVLKFDLTDGLANPQSLLPNSADLGGSTNYGDPILFEDSIYYVKQAAGSGANSGGQIWRYDLESETIQLLYNLKDAFGIASGQSGSLKLGIENGKNVIYFLTEKDSQGDNFGALYRLDIVAVPEPGVVGLLLLGLGLCGRRLYRCRLVS